MSESDSSTHYLSGVKAYIIPTKLRPYAIESMKKQLEKHGGEACPSQKDASVILTSLTAAPRIKRHVENHQVPVVSTQWLKDCGKQREHIAMDKYTIEMPRSNNQQQGEQPKATDTAAKDVDENTPDISHEILNRRYANMPPDPLPGYDEEDDPDLNERSTGGGDDDDSLAPDYLNSKYECLRPTPLKPYHNRKLVALLRLLERQREVNMEERNALSYRHAIAAIKAYPRKLRSGKEAHKITGIGEKISTLVQLYIDTGTIPDAEKLLSDEKFRTLSLFVKVFGVGTKTANMWYNSGYRTLKEVLEKAKLVKAVKLGIQLLPHFDQPMSRSDVEELIDIINKELPNVDKHAFTQPVGGYRRGKEQNGDLDIVIASRKLEHTTDHLLKRIVEHMIEAGYVKHVLLMSGKNSNHFGNHYTSGAADMEKLDTCFVAFMQPSTQIMRQVDFIVAALDDQPTAVLGWTGSRQFERSIRDYAKKEKNLSVQSHGMFDRTSSKKLASESEKQIFEMIGIPWLEPEMRNC